MEKDKEDLNPLEIASLQFEHADQDLTQEFAPEIHLILVALGHPEAFVTDLSSVSDFTCVFDSKDERLADAQRRLGLISKKYGFDITTSDLLVDIARKMREFRDAQWAETGRR